MTDQEMGAPPPKTHVTGDNQPRYTTKRLLDEIAKARSYGMELAASMCVERAAEYDASFESTAYKKEFLAGSAALTTIAARIREQAAQPASQDNVPAIPGRQSETYAAAQQVFADYFARNYPGPDTIIFDPAWHAPKFFAAACRAITETNEAEAAAIGRQRMIEECDE